MKTIILKISSAAYKPQLLTDPGEVEAVVGKDVTLECKFFGSPNADVSEMGVVGSEAIKMLNLCYKRSFPSGGTV